MSFKDDRHKARICKTLLRICHLERYWFYDAIGIYAGPTEDAVKELYLVKSDESLLSTGERILLRVAFDIWNGNGEASLWDIVQRLDSGLCVAVGELLIAIPDEDPRSMDKWEEDWIDYDPVKEFSS